MTADVTIWGAGIVGLCVATELVARGVQVKLFDPNGSVGRHACSWWAGGMLAPDCEGFTAEPDVVAQGRHAADWWARHTKLQSNGTLVVSLGRDRSELNVFARRVASAAPVNPVDLEPDLDRFDRGLFLDGEAHVTPRAALADLQAALSDKGVDVGQCSTVEGQLVDCRGLAAQDVLPDLRGVRGEMVVISCTDIDLKRPVRLLHPRFPLYIVPRGDGVFMLGATQIESGARGPATVRSTVELLNAAYALHPAFAEAEVLEIGADARPAFPDNMPRIRKLADRICVNGLFRHGFMLSPALAKGVADLITTGTQPEVWYEDFS